MLYDLQVNILIINIKGYTSKYNHYDLNEDIYISRVDFDFSFNTIGNKTINIPHNIMSCDFYIVLVAQKH